MNWNAAHIHLVFNHIPVIGGMVVLVVLAWGLLRKKPDVLYVGLWLQVAIALLSIVAFLSGDGAADIVREHPDISRNLIHNHEEVAETAFTLMEVTGGLALLSLILRKWRTQWMTYAAWLCLIAAVITAGAMGYAANLGGLIHHTEIRSNI
ncbi:MAG: hypothetical protein COV45_01190 [Deltaproteobacteria bacterium CG11_big_fil_rev_8_21_14_0_20_47_16]|nr:MAG: hypothetical protein COV45_01190 [Deltaproteobacteria bacterium CG11_big_fil_rev_8_21_14_0_20_47_16]